MNETQALYDYAPLLQLMLLGATIALGPLAWVAWRSRGGARGKRLQALMVLTLFLTFDLVMFGAFTRLTDSGLGCPDWPGCYGNASPIGAREEISAAQDAMPTGPVTHGKAWVEMIHRYLASAVGVLIIAINVGVWRQKRQWQREGRTGDEPLHPGWAVATLVWVCLQGVFGAWTVTMKLFPAIVTLHLIGGLVLLALLCAQAVRQVRTVQGVQPVQLPVNLRWAMVAALALVWIQVALGGWVSTNYAVLACTTFPTCQGSWWPAMDFAQALQIWRPLGLLADGSHISFEALTAIHYTHRLMAYVVILALAGLWMAMRHAPALSRQRRLLGFFAVLQVLTGLSNVVLDWPLVAAVLHTGGAAALVTIVVWSLTATRCAGSPTTTQRPARGTAYKE